MQMIHNVLGTIWGGCSQIVLSQAYFPSFPLDFSPMQWKSLHNNHFFQSFKNNFLTLDRTSKAPTKLLFYIKKESILHKIVKSQNFLPLLDYLVPKVEKLYQKVSWQVTYPLKGSHLKANQSIFHIFLDHNFFTGFLRTLKAKFIEFDDP